MKVHTNTTTTNQDIISPIKQSLDALENSFQNSTKLSKSAELHKKMICNICGDVTHDWNTCNQLNYHVPKKFNFEGKSTDSEILDSEYNEKVKKLVH